MSPMLYTGEARKEPGMGESIPRDAQAYYNRGVEAGRLFRSHGLIEFARTQEIILRHLPPPPCTILDVGGGPGAYAGWLASLGHRVTLIDAVPLHVEQAQESSARRPEAPLVACRLGDAQRLEEGDATARAVLLLGPLYHLTERRDRLQALGEARRVPEPGGLLFAAAVSRYASLLSGVADNPSAIRISRPSSPAICATASTGIPRTRTTSRPPSSIAPMSSRPRCGKPASTLSICWASKAPGGFSPISSSAGPTRRSASACFRRRGPSRASPRSWVSRLT